MRLSMRIFLRFIILVVVWGGSAKTEALNLAAGAIEQTAAIVKLPDTGQTGDYTSTFGEDSDYLLNPPAYTDNGNGTITDKVTGLLWQKSDGGEMSWENAKIYADSLSIGGYNDWRLPNSHELFNILDHGRLNPAMDTGYFPKTKAEYWWSANERVDDATKIWVVNAGGGIGAHPKDETISSGGSKRFHVRCVREVTPISEPENRFNDNDDGTVTDNLTGLIWQQDAPEAAKTWEDALIYCQQLSLADHDDWRLPNIKELRSISDDHLMNPSLDKTYFPDASSELYWSSTTEMNQPAKAWTVDFNYGLVSYAEKSGAHYIRAVRGGMGLSMHEPEMILIPGGEFEMGDHHDFVDPNHGGDETPVHSVLIDSFYLAMTQTTNQQYCDYLNSAIKQNIIEVREGLVYEVDGDEVFCFTTLYADYSSIAWSGSEFSIIDHRANHPVVGVMWFGAAAYCNWLSSQQDLEPCYNLQNGDCDFSKNGFRLPTEAEWEYAGRGGQNNPYFIFPWGDDADSSKANWPESNNPYQSGPYPWTTPVGFYNGQLHQKTDFNWPGEQLNYQTSDGRNAFGLYDMAGNVWEFVNDWYGREYYSTSPYDNPTGPESGTIMPDGKAYRGMRGGNWYNGDDGHSRVSNRNPSYYRGPDDPNHAWYHIGFRIARNFEGNSTGLESSNFTGPNGFRLGQNYPNPFNPSTTIEYRIPAGNQVQLEIFNILGQKVVTLVSQFMAAGSYNVRWNGLNQNGVQVSPGIYICRLQSDARTDSKKMVFLP